MVDHSLQSRSTFEVNGDNVIFKVDIDCGRYKVISFEKYQEYYFISTCQPAMLSEDEVYKASFYAKFFRYCCLKYFNHLDNLNIL